MVTNPTPQKQRWALLAGISQYQNSQFAALPSCAGSARALSEMLLQPGCQYAPEQVCLITAEGANSSGAGRLEILKSLNEVAQKTNEEDQILFYFSGYGAYADGKACLLPGDVYPGPLLNDTAIPLERVKEILQRKARAHDRMILLDILLIDANGAVDGQDQENFNRDVMQDSNCFSIEVHFRTAGETSPWNPFLALAAGSENHSSELTRLIRFPFPNPVNDVQDFYGRAVILKEIQNTLENATRSIMVVIEGERCIGKTSFLNRAKKLLDESRASQTSRNHFLHFSLEPHSAHSVESFAREIWDGLSQTLEDAGFSIPAELTRPFRFDTFTGFARSLKRISAEIHGITFVIFVDEFDKISKNTGPTEYIQMIGLIQYIMQVTDLPILFFISALQELPKSYGSPIPQHKKKLGPFTYQEMKEMLEGILNGYLQVSLPALNAIYEATGGHPFFAKLVLRKLLNTSGVSAYSNIPVSLINSAAQEAAFDLDAQDLFKDIYWTYMNDDQRLALFLTASLPRQLLTDEVYQSQDIKIQVAIGYLRERGYLVNEPGVGDKFQIGMLSTWLQSGLPFLRQEMERLHVIRALKLSGVFPAETKSTEDVRALPEVRSTPIPTTGLYIDRLKEQIWVDGVQIKTDLSNLQYRALVLLADKHDQVVSRDDIALCLHPEDKVTMSEASIDTLISRLRYSIHDRVKPYRFLETVHNRGFRLKNVTISPLH